MANDLTADEARRLIAYDPDTGDFRWKITVNARAPAGSVAGYVKPDGYRLIMIGYKNLRAHRLAWLIMTGSWPPRGIDHEDLDRSNNRWLNLRLATKGQNAANAPIRADNSSGVKGVYWNRDRRKWSAQVTLDGKTKYLGLFEDISEAAAARARANVAAHGEFARVA